MPTGGDNVTATISSWVAHANREPSAALLNGMNEWWQQIPIGNDPLRACPWLTSSFHRLLLVHIDRAAHKRRHVPQFVCSTDCTLDDHGPSPIATMLHDDAYGPSPISMHHSVERTALGDAIELVKGRDSALTVAVIEEADFENANDFDVHRSALISAQRDGVALPIIHVAANGPEAADHEIGREDLLRAAGWATYLIDVKDGEEPLHLHARLAACMEDVFDEVAQIKADAAARVLMSDPLWPAVVVRTTAAWRDEHSYGASALGNIASAF
jgi:hypothetical protein